MASTYTLSPIPLWVIMNNTGTVAGGAKMYTYSSLTRAPKAVYQDPAGTLPYTNPVNFNANGTSGPFYWQYDAAAPTDLYYLYVTDANGVFLWELNNYYPPQAGGGGAVVNNYISLENYIANGILVNNCGNVSSPVGTNVILAPSNHHGFTPAVVPVVGTNGGLGPDIRLLKGNASATDTIAFQDFALANGPFTGDPTPPVYMQYQCTVAGAGESYKYIQFPITQKVKNLANTQVTFQIYMMSAVSPVSIPVYTRQYFGSGTGAGIAGNPDIQTIAGTLSLTGAAAWQRFNVQFTVPSVASGTLGAVPTGDDALYIQVGLPVDSACDISWTKASLHLGTISNDSDFDTYDQVDSVTQTPRTGDVRASFQNLRPLGWLPMDDSTIGNTGSGANYAGVYTYQLYKTLWDSVSDTYAPVSTGRGATATADFIAGKTLTMPLALGRALAGAGAGSGLSVRALGQNTGAESYTLVANDLPPHTHGFTVPFSNQANSRGGGAADTVTNSVAYSSNTSANSTANNPVSLMQPTFFTNIYIKL